jgi:hydrogenase nickel incorporation protein HypB
MCLDCGCENANLIKHNPKLENLNSVEFSELKPMIDKIKVGKDILSKNNNLADQNRKQFKEEGTRVFNFMSSPGAGKTTLLCALFEFLESRNQTEVVVGDLETSIDADRLKKYYSSVEQINTESSCHLDATHLSEVKKSKLGKGVKNLFIENIGNLVCPASFDLGENYRIAVISVTEGEEKPLKYPMLFKDADLCIVTKTDLIPYLDYDLSLLESNVKKINSDIPVLKTSSKNLEGLKELAEWIEEK